MGMRDKMNESGSKRIEVVWTCGACECMHRGLLKKRKQRRGVRPLEGALRRTVPDRSSTNFQDFQVRRIWLKRVRVGCEGRMVGGRPSTSGW